MHWRIPQQVHLWYESPRWSRCLRTRAVVSIESPVTMTSRLPNQAWFYGSQYGRHCSRIDFDRAPNQIDVARGIGHYTYFLLVQVTKCVRVAAHSATDIRTVDHRTADRRRDRGFVD